MDVPPRLPERPIRFEHRLRAFIRTRNLAYKTERTYVFWIKRYIRFNGLTHPSELSAQAVEGFITHLAVNRNVSVNTQRTALNALVFLYREFLQMDIGDLVFKQARKPRRVPVVFSHGEAMAAIDRLEGDYQLIAQLMYGSGLRIAEALRLRIKDIGFCWKRVTTSAPSRHCLAMRTFAPRKSIPMWSSGVALVSAVQSTMGPQRLYKHPLAA